MSAVADRASVLICSRNRPQMLVETVRSLLAGDTLPGELVVVDQSERANAELDGLDEVDGCHVRYLRSATVGLSRARNVALGAATRDVAVMIDDDMLIEPGWLGELLAGLGEGSLTVATGRVLPAPREGEAGVIPPAALVEREEPAVFRGVQPLDVVPGANVALPRAFVLELGGYDERLGAGSRFAAADDNDMGHRLLMAGCEVRHVPTAVVLHRAWRTRSELVRLRWAYGRGKGAFYAKHASLRDRGILRRGVADVGRRLRRAVASLPREPKASAAELISVAGILAGALDWTLTVRLADRLRGARGP